MMMCLAVYEPGPSAPLGASVFDAFTVILPGASITASPQISDTLFFRNRKETPSDSRFATPRERVITAFGSNETFSAERPNSLAFCIRWKTSAVRSSAFVGMQPQLVQMPPI